MGFTSIYQLERYDQIDLLLNPLVVEGVCINGLRNITAEVSDPINAVVVVTNDSADGGSLSGDPRVPELCRYRVVGGVDGIGLQKRGCLISGSARAKRSRGCLADLTV